MNGNKITEEGGKLASDGETALMIGLSSNIHTECSILSPCGSYVTPGKITDCPD